MVNTLSVGGVGLSASLEIRQLNLIVSYKLLVTVLFTVLTPTLVLTVFFLTTVVAECGVTLRDLVRARIRRGCVNGAFSAACLVTGLTLPVTSFLFKRLLSFS